MVEQTDKQTKKQMMMNLEEYYLLKSRKGSKGPMSRDLNMALRSKLHNKGHNFFPNNASFKLLIRPV